MKPNQIEKHIWLYEDVLTKEQCETLIEKYEITNTARKGHALFREKVEEIEIPTFDPTDEDYNADAWELWNGVDDHICEFADNVLHTYLSNYMVKPYEYAYCGCKMLFYPPLSHSPMHYDDELVAKDGGTIGVARPITYAALTGARGYRVGRMARGASGEQDSEYSIPRKHAGEHIRKHFWALELCRLPFHGHDKRELHGDGQHCGVGQHNLVCTWKFCARHADGHAGDRLFCWSVREQWACSIHG